MLKHFFKNVFRLVGLNISRIAPSPPAIHQIKIQKVGRFTLEYDRQVSLFDELQRNPDYTGHLGRLAAFLRKNLPENFRMIDVGANVGDTVAIVRNHTDIPILCIEGDNHCFQLLEKNLRQFTAVSAVKTFLADEVGNQMLSVEKVGWNSTFVSDGNLEIKQSVSLTTLDKLLETRAERGDYRLLKIDTEGFDPKIIRGAVKFIRDIRPVLHFEYNRETMAKTNEDGRSVLTLLENLGYTSILFYEAWGRFVHATTLQNHDFIQDAHDYADGFNGAVYYFDMIVFPGEMQSLAEQFVELERQYRNSHSGPRT